VSHRLLIKDPQGEREVLLVDSIAVGRDPRCDVTSADPLVSRRHAEFVASGVAVVVRDLDSRNGILVNGRREIQAVLQPGDVVQIAQMAVTLLSRVEAETRLAPAGGHDPAVNGTAPHSFDEKTSLLSTAEIRAVAEASGSRSPGNGAPSGHGPGAASAVDGNGARKSGAWSVRVAADDDRTSLLPQAATLPGVPAEPLSATPHDAPPASGAPVPDLDLNPRPAVERAAPRLRAGGGRAFVYGALVLAALGYVAGVASTLLWLQPPLTWRGLVENRAPAALAVGFVLVLVAGALAGLVIGRKVGRV
jgi:hypothetical protein